MYLISYLRISTEGEILEGAGVLSPVMEEGQIHQKVSNLLERDGTAVCNGMGNPNPSFSQYVWAITARMNQKFAIVLPTLLAVIADPLRIPALMSANILSQIRLLGRMLVIKSTAIHILWTSQHLRPDPLSTCPWTLAIGRDAWWKEGEEPEPSVVSMGTTTWSCTQGIYLCTSMKDMSGVTTKWVKYVWLNLPFCQIILFKF